jgi:hypothetical protein
MTIGSTVNKTALALAPVLAAASYSLEPPPQGQGTDVPQPERRDRR